MHLKSKGAYVTKSVPATICMTEGCIRIRYHGSSIFRWFWEHLDFDMPIQAVETISVFRCSFAPGLAFLAFCDTDGNRITITNEAASWVTLLEDLPSLFPGIKLDMIDESFLEIDTDLICWQRS